MKENQPDPKKPGRVSKPKQKVTKSTPTANSRKTAKTKQQPDNHKVVEDVIKQAFMRFYDQSSVRLVQDTEVSQLDTIVSEYLDNFLILGYDTAGQKVSIMHATTPYGRDALIEHLRATLIGIVGGDPGM